MNPQSAADLPPGSVTDIHAPEQLAAVREAKGWSKSEVAAKLGMMPRQIDAMENGRWQDLPGHAFVRGGLRAYGKALQVDVSSLLATLADPAAMPELRRSASLDSPLSRRGALGFGSGGGGSRIAWILLGVVGVVVIALYFARTTEPVSGEPVSPEPVSQTGAAEPAPAGAPAHAPAGVAQTPQAGVTDTPIAGAPAQAALRGAAPAAGSGAGVDPAGVAPAPKPVDPASGVTTAAPASVAPALAAGGVTGGAGSATVTGAARTEDARAGAPDAGAKIEATTGASVASAQPALVFRFERESWVEVRDGNGQILLRGTQPAGSRREISGPKPWTLIVGNADFVRIEQDGTPLELGPVTQKGVARLRIE